MTWLVGCDLLEFFFLTCVDLPIPVPNLMTIKSFKYNVQMRPNWIVKWFLPIAQTKFNFVLQTKFLL